MSFLRIGTLLFSETWHGVKSPFIDVCDIVRFLQKNPNQADMTKNDLKTGFLEFLRKSRH